MTKDGAGGVDNNDRHEDQLLVERVQAGEKAAFDLLVRKYQVRVNHLVSRFVRDSGDAEDVVQEAFIRAYRAIGKFRGESGFYTWLYRIAVNTAKNHLVSMGRRPPATDVEVEVAEFSTQAERFRDIDTPDACLRSVELSKAIQSAMDGLPAELAKALTLRELAGLSYAEIAKELNCPVGTVRSRNISSKGSGGARDRESYLKTGLTGIRFTGFKRLF